MAADPLCVLTRNSIYLYYICLSIPSYYFTEIAVSHKVRSLEGGGLSKSEQPI